ncbi:MAG TPA: hypothetical protein VNA14_14090 [Mycobacteriales bacterium]|nr:hypothetical protein [Mycobacteriales bacterium]
MTKAATPTFTDALTIAEQHHQLQMWRAAQVVASHVKVGQQRDEVLDCLGLSEVVRPPGA